MAMKTLDDLFVHFVEDMYYAEKQLLKTLPKMAKKAGSPELRKAFEDHHKETEGHVERLKAVFEMIGRRPKAETCEAIDGITEEGKEIMDEASDTDALDAGMIASAQAVEHYEIARYGTLVAWAKQLGHREAAAELQKTLDEEHDADRLLTKLAESKLNKRAA